MWVPGRLWGLGREEGVGTEGKTATDSSMCLSFCLSPWWHTRMPDPQGVICSGALQHLLIPPWWASFSQTEMSFERKREEGKEEAAALTVERKLTFPSSSSAFRSKDRCSWTVVEPEEPCHGGVTETGERKMSQGRENKRTISFLWQLVLLPCFHLDGVVNRTAPSIHSRYFMLEQVFWFRSKAPKL